MRLLNNEIEERITIKLNKTFKSDTVSGIMTFGEKNDYPQVIEKLILGSQTAKAARKVYAKFIAGSGFRNPEIGKIVVGIDNKGKDITLDKVRVDVAKSLATFNGAYIHSNINLEGLRKNTSIIPFKNCRFSILDDVSNTGKIAVCGDWLANNIKGKISFYDNFSNRLSVIESQVEKNSLEKYKGQIYALTLEDDYLYPLSCFDSVYLDMDTEYQSQLFRNREIRNGFSDKVILLLDAMSDESERTKQVEKIQSWMGADGDKALVFEATFDEESGELVSNSNYKIDKIPSNINPKVLDGVDATTSNNIRKAANALPKVLIDYEQGALGSGNVIVDAFTFYNSVVKSDTQKLAEGLREIYSHYDNEILRNNTDWDILPLTM